MEKDNLDTPKHIYPVLQLKQPMKIPITVIHKPILTIPNDINWELWLGPAPWAPYNSNRCDGNFEIL